MATLSFISASKLIELLAAANKQERLFVRIVGANRLALGVDPLQPTLLIDVSKEKIGPYEAREVLRPSGLAGNPEPSPVTAPLASYKVTRRTGDYWFEISGKRTGCRSLKDLLSGSLAAIEKKSPGTLEKLSNVKARSRRIVARERNRLFDKEHLIAKYAEELVPGWWYGTNNSGEQVEVWLRRACELSGLEWERDFKMQAPKSTPTFDESVEL